MIIKVLSRNSVKKFKTSEKHIVISVRDPESNKVELPEQKSRLDVLYLTFHDLDKEHPSKTIVLFAKSQAELVWKFVQKYKNNINMIVVNCEAGISRSAGIAGALSKVLDGQDDFYFKHYCPNRLVYRTMLEVGINQKQKEESNNGSV
jgi:predicted protein tyrosine phosphatase